MSTATDETRDRILRTTWHLLATAGGREIRMVDIAKAAKISRQALYLHFSNRTDLLIETTHYIDKINGIDARLAASRAAETGEARLGAFIEAWLNYIPEIHAVASALHAAEHADDAARAAWNDRMQAVRQGCVAAMDAVQRDGRLRSGFTVDDAADLLWVQLSLHNWSQLTQSGSWSQTRYVEAQKTLALRSFLTET
jgi:AcrR family transcriptional regulator